MSKREELREKRRKEQNRRRNAIIIVVSLVVVAVAAGLILPNMVGQGDVGTIAVVTPHAVPKANGMSMGDLNAPVKVLEFADFQCPYCRKFSEQVEPQLISQYIDTGKVFFTYVTYPFIDQAPGAKGSESHHAAEAAYCAADQGLFWQFQDMLYTNQQSENTGGFSDARLKAIAEKTGMNMTAYNSCFISHRYQSQVQQDVAKGDSYKIDGTPAFVINDKLWTGNWTDVAQGIDAALAGK